MPKYRKKSLSLQKNRIIMNKKHVTFISIALLLSSCGMLNNGINTGKKAQSPEYYISQNGDRVPVQQKTEQTVQVDTVQTAVKPQETIQNKPVEYVDTVDYSKLINGEWILVEVNGEKVTGDNRPYLTFEAAKGRYYGSNGCNVLNGTYKAKAEGVLELGEGATTMMICNDAPYEYLINGALGQTVGFRIAKSGTESLLHLLSNRGRTVMLLKRTNLDYVNGAWKVTAINGSTELVNDKMQFVFDMENLTIHGNAGCNIVNGKMFLDPDIANSLQFHGLASTRMMCPDLNGETALLVAFEETATCFKVDSNTIVFKNKTGEELIRFDKLDIYHDKRD